MTDLYSNIEEDMFDEAPLVLDTEEILDKLITLVSSAKSMPLSSSVLVGRDEVIAILHDALGRLPEELREARWLLKEREAFLREQARQAEQMMEEVRAQAERMVSRTEIVRQANSVAQRIVDDANDEARRLRHEAEDYCDQKLAAMQIVLDRVSKTVEAGRAKLQATTPVVGSIFAAVEPGVPGGSGLSESGDDSFFDQDIV